jgi:ParB family chromosome partitioning protein
MQVIDLPLDRIVAAPWNPNRMDPAMVVHLRRSLTRFGFVVPLVVREVAPGSYETIGGAQRLAMAREMGLAHVPCVLVKADDAEARLLSQCLNRIAGEDDLGLRAELVREILKALPQEEVLALLPETAESLQALCSLGQEDMASYLRNWQQAQGARLKHLQFQLTESQLEVVEEVLARLLPMAKESRGNSPNIRGTALYLLCKGFLEGRGV